MHDLLHHFSYNNAVIRIAESRDIKDLVAIINEAYFYQDKVKGEPRTNIEHLTKRISETDFYVIEETDEIVGCVYLEPHDESLHFGLLTVIPKARGTGLAPAVIDAIAKYAASSSYKFLDLDYMSLAPWLKKYYEKYGFEETGEKVEWGAINLVRMRRRV